MHGASLPGTPAVRLPGPFASVQASEGVSLLSPTLGRSGVVVSADLRYPFLVTVATDAALRVWNMETGGIVRATSLNDPSSSLPLRPNVVAFSHVSDILAVGFDSGLVQFMAFETLETSHVLENDAKAPYMPKIVRSLERSARGVVSIRFSPSNRLVAVARLSSQIEVLLLLLSVNLSASQYQKLRGGSGGRGGRKEN